MAVSLCRIAATAQRKSGGCLAVPAGLKIYSKTSKGLRAATAKDRQTAHTKQRQRGRFRNARDRQVVERTGLTSDLEVVAAEEDLIELSGGDE